MTTDQQIALFNAFGAWAAAIATVAAVIVSLWIALRSERVQLRVVAGIRLLLVGDGTPGTEHLWIDVTNYGPRPVTVSMIGWAVGRRRKRRYCLIPLFDAFSSRLPVDLEHGKDARFLVSLEKKPDWIAEFVTKFIYTEDDIKTLVVQVHTSVGKTIEVHPEKELLDRIRAALPSQPKT